jgi:drug/metabolite transporter (DMT)-like permease
MAIIGGALAALFFTGAILSATRATRMIGPLSTLGGVMLTSAVVAAPIVVVTAAGTSFPTDSLLWLAIAGAGNVGGLFSEYAGLRIGKVGIVGALAAAEGAVAAVLSVLAGEVLEPVVGAGVAVVGVGVVLAAFARDPDTSSGASRRVRAAVVFGLLAGLAFGASLYATGRLGASLAIGWALAPPRVVGVALITLPALATARLRVSRQALPFVIMAGACEVGGFLSFAWASAGGIAVSAALAAQFASLGAVIAWLWFGERLSRSQWAGIAAVGIGVVLLAVGSTA